MKKNTPGRPATSSARFAKAKKGWITINLRDSERRELNALSRAAGLPLNMSLRAVLLGMKMLLKEEARIRRLTGMNPAELSTVLKARLVEWN